MTSLLWGGGEPREAVFDAASAGDAARERRCRTVCEQCTLFCARPTMSLGKSLSETSLSRRRSSNAASLLPVTAPKQDACSSLPSFPTIVGMLTVLAVMLFGVSFLLFGSATAPAEPTMDASVTVSSVSRLSEDVSPKLKLNDPLAAAASTREATLAVKKIAEAAEAAAPVTEATTCKDTHARCIDWATAGECSKNEQYMTRSCPRSCGICSGSPAAPAAAEPTAQLVDHNKSCKQWAMAGECTKNHDYMAKACAHSCQAKLNEHDES